MEEKTNNTEQESTVSDDFVEEMFRDNAIVEAELQQQIAARQALLAGRISIDDRQREFQRSTTNFFEVQRVNMINQNRFYNIMLVVAALGVTATSVAWIEKGAFAGYTSAVLSMVSFIPIPFARRYWAATPNLQVEENEHRVVQEIARAPHHALLSTMSQQSLPTINEVEEAVQEPESRLTIIITSPDSIVTPLITARNSYVR